MAVECKGTCAYHEDRDKLITDISKQINRSIGPAVNQHKAYWRFFFWGAGIILGTLSLMIGSLYSAVNTEHDSIIQLKVAIEQQGNTFNREVDFITKRQDGQKYYIKQFEDRIRQLEIAGRVASGQ